MRRLITAAFAAAALVAGLVPATAGSTKETSVITCAADMASSYVRGRKGISPRFADA